MALEIFLFGNETQKYCGEILHSIIPQCLLKDSDKIGGDFILLRRTDPEEVWCVFDGKQKEVLQIAGKYGLRTLTCGFSSYNTLVLSSTNSEQAVISLLREIHTVYGKSVEPGDYLIHRHQRIPDQALLFCAGVLLLLGRQETEFRF